MAKLKAALLRRIALHRIHWLGLLVMMAVASVSLAWNSYQLVSISMENIDYLDMQGFEAIRAGALGQLAWLMLKGAIALVSYIVFKGAEVELITRWRRLD